MIFSIRTIHTNNPLTIFSASTTVHLPFITIFSHHRHNRVCTEQKQKRNAITRANHTVFKLLAGERGETEPNPRTGHRHPYPCVLVKHDVKRVEACAAPITGYLIRQFAGVQVPTDATTRMEFVTKKSEDVLLGMRLALLFE